MTLHNIPEGMAVGVIYAGLLSRAEHITEIGAFSLALGIAIQKLPGRSDYFSATLYRRNVKKESLYLWSTFRGSRASGGGVYCLGLKPYRSASAILLSFAAGAMFYVVVEELIPEMSAGKYSNIGTILFSFDFTNADA